MTDFFIVHAGEYIGAYRPTKHPIISYTNKKNFADFIEGIREDYPNCRLRCVADKKIEQKIFNQIQIDNARGCSCER